MSRVVSCGTAGGLRRGEVKEETASELFLFLCYSRDVELDCVDVKDYVYHMIAV